jgi:extracellular factor (EF) 3-hydroxypalmitic acid methyl ester biosynthesis protein
MPPFSNDKTTQQLGPVDPVVTFRNSQGDAVRGTLVNLQRRALVIEIYNPYSIIQISEVLFDLTVRSGEKPIYQGKAVVTSLLNTGLMAVVSVTLTDEWSELNRSRGEVSRVGDEARHFVEEWTRGFRVRQSYQVMVSEFRTFLSDTSRWIGQVDLSDTLPHDNDQHLRNDIFEELATPFIEKGAHYIEWLEAEASSVPQEDAVMHAGFAQAMLHPLLLRAPFVHRTFTKPLGYAGDYEMVNQILSDPRQGPNTYFQVVNTFFLKCAVAEAHRNRIDILVDHLDRLAAAAPDDGPPQRVLNVACGPAAEIQRFIEQNPRAGRLAFTLIDFNAQTLEYTRSRIGEICRRSGRSVQVEFLHESVHGLLKRAAQRSDALQNGSYDFVYCAGLFDYLSDKVCARLLEYFSAHARPAGSVLTTNVHSCNKQKRGMEHLLEWHLVYRDEQQFAAVLPEGRTHTSLYRDATGVNIFAEYQVPASLEPRGNRQ